MRVGRLETLCAQFQETLTIEVDIDRLSSAMSSLVLMSLLLIDMLLVR
jgi:hypothetical protein